MNKQFRLILAVLALIGIAAAIGKAFIWGDAVVNYGSYVPWGLWVSLYAFLVGTAAGTVMFGVWLGYKHNSMNWIKLSFVSAAISLVGALAFIGLDLGKPLKGISIFYSPSFSSPLAWASWGYALFILAVIILLAKEINSVKSPVVIIALITALIFLSAETIFFSGMIARPLWHNWSNSLAFITSAIAAGGAMLYLIASLVAPTLIKDTGLRKIVLYAVILHLIVGIGHAGLEAKLPEAMAQLADWKFWVLFVGLGGIAALYLLSKSTTAVWGSGISLLGLIAYKYLFVSAAFTEPALPGLPQAFQHVRLSLHYTPSAVEWLVAVGLLSAVLLAILVYVPKVLGLLNRDGQANTSVKA